MLLADHKHSQLGRCRESPLFVQVMDHYKEFLETQGQAELAAVAVTRKQWEAGFDLESLPDIPQADLPPQPSQVCHH